MLMLTNRKVSLKKQSLCFLLSIEKGTMTRTKVSSFKLFISEYQQFYPILKDQAF